MKIIGEYIKHIFHTGNNMLTLKDKQLPFCSVRYVPSKEVWERERNVLGAGPGLRNIFWITVGLCSLGSKQEEGAVEKSF